MHMRIIKNFRQSCYCTPSTAYVQLLHCGNFATLPYKKTNQVNFEQTRSSRLPIILQEFTSGGIKCYDLNLLNYLFNAIQKYHDMTLRRAMTESGVLRV